MLPFLQPLLDIGWSGGAMVLGKLSVPVRPTNMACRGAGGGGQIESNIGFRCRQRNPNPRVNG